MGFDSLPSTIFKIKAMARSIQEIKDTITAEFMASSQVRDLYNLTEGDSFEESFSTVSLENILFGIFATCVWVVEKLMDKHKEEVATMAGEAIVATVKWYYDQALKFQKGDALVYNPTTKGWGYATEDPKKQIVKYAAVRDEGNRVLVLASQDNEGVPQKLSDDDLSLFSEYMNRIKIAGVVLSVKSFDADVVKIYATVKIDPLVIKRSGVLFHDNIYPVEDAINNYLRHITYGGAINKNHLVVAIQAVAGVKDVTLNRVECSIDGTNFSEFEGNEYNARSGCFMSDNLRYTLTYVV